MKPAGFRIRCAFSGMLLLAACACACATSGSAGGGAGSGAGADAGVVELRVGAEAFTRADLQRANPQLFTPGVTHGKMLKEAFVQRFVDFRLAVAEARRRGLEDSEAFRSRFENYLDAKSAEALVADLKIKEEKPGTYADSDLAEDLIDDQRRAQIRGKLLAQGHTFAPKPGTSGGILESLSGADAGKVVAQVGQDLITAGQVRDLLSLKELAAPRESDAARALDELILFREIVAVARSGGYRDRAAAAEATAGFREKLLEAVLGEDLVPPGSLSAAAVADYFAANGEKYERLEAVRLRRMVLPESVAGEVFKRLRKGEDFGALAKKHSLEEATAAAGGDLGWVVPGTEGIAPLAFTLKAGAHSRLEKTARGFEVLRVDERRVARPPLETISAQVRRDAEAGARTVALRDLVTGLRERTEVWKSEELQK